MSPPIRAGSGDSIGSIRLGVGSEISEVRTGAGDVLFSGSAIPDSVQYQVNAKELSGFNDGDTVNTRPAQVGQNDMNTVNGDPEYQSSAINGYAGVVYDSSNSEYHSVSYASDISEPYTVIVVYKHTESAWGDIYSQDGVQNPYLGDDPGTPRYLQSAGSPNTGGSPSQNTPTVAVGKFTGDSGSFFRANGTEILSGDVGSVSPVDSLRLGERGDGKKSFDGPISFFEIHSGEPSNGLKTREQQVADMWDITI